MLSGNSLRGVEKNWQIDRRENQEEKAENSPKIPSYSVIRQWLAKIGLYELQRQKEKRDDWVWILDFREKFSAHVFSSVVKGIKFGFHEGDII